MKFTVVFASLLAAMTVSALPATDASSDSTIPVVALPLLDGDSAFNGHIFDPRAAADTVSCYGSGTKIDRKYAIQAIDDFCQVNSGKTINVGQSISTTYTFSGLNGITFLVSVNVNNGCPFGGRALGDECPIFLRRPIDQCNTGGENGKQGGVFTDNCASYRVDPGTPGSDS